MESSAWAHTKYKMSIRHAYNEETVADPKPGAFAELLI